MSQTTAFAEYQAQALSAWSELLDAVCWIDAPNQVLIERIKTREKEHRAKGFSSEELSEFLSEYRSELECTLREIRRRSDVELLALDSSALPASACVQMLLVAGGL